MMNLTISIDTRQYQVLAAAAEAAGNGDMSVRQCIEVQMDDTVNAIVEASA